MACSLGISCVTQGVASTANASLAEVAAQLARANREEIVTTALYLASPASSYTTGALIRVDGGLY